jgi:hypothetical protein
LTDRDIPACPKQAAYNMKRMINIFGVNPLMQAIAA